MAAPFELFGPALARIVLALSAGLGLIVAAERKRLSSLTSSVLFLRWRTWALSGPLFAAAVLGPWWVGVLFVSALSVQALREYSSIVELPRPYRRALYVAAAASAPIAAGSLTVWRAMPPILLLVATLAPLWMQDVEKGVQRLAYAGFGFAYIPWLLGYLLLLRDHVVGGPGLLLALGMAIAAGDVCAFAVGKLCGRHPLARRLSPAKTIEGAAGNLVGAYLGFFLMSFALPEGIGTAQTIILPVVVAVGSVWGDLVESLIKRQFGVKDAGNWLPGFGGLLDRIDSMLVVLPLSYTVMVLWPW